MANIEDAICAVCHHRLRDHTLWHDREEAGKKAWDHCVACCVDPDATLDCRHLFTEKQPSD